MYAAALYTSGFRKAQVFTALEFATGLQSDTPAPDRVKAIPRRRRVGMTELDQRQTGLGLRPQDRLQCGEREHARDEIGRASCRERV